MESSEGLNPFRNYYGTSNEMEGTIDGSNKIMSSNILENNSESVLKSYTISNGDHTNHPVTTEVDLSKYPEPKDSSKKIRGRSDLIEWFCGPINRELIIAKAFYFFFFSAFGSLLPLMAIYFKNMGMTPTQAGILIGIRPFVGYLSAPFWADLADRFRKGKIMLLCSLAAWIIFNVPLGFIHPPPNSCLTYNGTHFFIELPETNRLVKRSLDGNDFYSSIPSTTLDSHEFVDAITEGMGDLLSDEKNELQDTQFGLLMEEKSLENDPWDGEFISPASQVSWRQLLDLEQSQSMDVPLNSQEFVRVRRLSPNPVQPSNATKPNHQVGKSPYTLEFAVNYDSKQHSNLVSPTFSYTVFNLDGVRKVFFLFLLLIVIGEFFCCPSITLADSAVLALLGKERADQYGRQRMFASIGWGITMFFVCLTLDRSHSFSDHPCQVHDRERNYTICYVSFTIFMGCTMLVATRLPFNYTTTSASTSSLQASAATLSPVQSSGYRPPGTWANPKPPPPPPGSQAKSEIMGDVLKNLLGKSKVFAQTTRQIPEWMPVLRHFANLKCASFMFVAWFMGFGIGLIFTFLFWHLQDYGGTSTVFGMASVVNHISEMLAYFLSYPLIRKIGHIKVLCLGLIGSVIRFLYISYIREPWGVIPFELIQGITHSAVWAAACSYIAHNTPQELRISAQGVLQFIHNGLGRACGTIFGGLFSTYYGTTDVLRGYGVACIIVFVIFVAINFYRPDKGFTANLTPAEDPHQVAEEMAHLAPHGVPSNPTIVRTASNVCLNSQSFSQMPKTLNYSTTNGSLDVPTPSGTNPFLTGQGLASNSFTTEEDYTGITITAPHYNINPDPNNGQSGQANISSYAYNAAAGNYTKNY